MIQKIFPSETEKMCSRGEYKYLDKNDEKKKAVGV